MQSECAFEDGERVPSSDFDYSKLDSGIDDPGNPLAGFDDEANRELFLIFGALWAEVLEWVYTPKNSRLVGMRLKAVVYCCRPQMLNGATLEEIAHKDGIKKQTFQDLTAKFRDRFKVTCRSMRTNVSRERMKEAALKVHAKKRAIQKEEKA